MSNLAISYHVLGRYADALKLFEEALAARKRVLPPDHRDTLQSMNNLATCYKALNRHAEALIDECVAKAAGRVVDPKMIPGVMSLRMQHFRKAADPAGCRATAAMWEALNRTDAVSLYNAGRFRAIAAAVQAKDSAADAARLATDDADRGMAWLTKAVAAGYQDRAQMEKDNDLDALRDRADFKQLLADLKEPADRALPPR